MAADLKGELSDHRRRDKALSLLLKSPSKKGRGWIFQTAARALAEGLGYRWAIVAEIVDDGRRARTLAFWDTDGFRKPLVFDLSGTPYGEVLKKRGYGLYRDGIKKLFPDDRSLAKIDAASHQSAVFFGNTRQPIGFVIAANDVAEIRKVGPLRDFLRLVTNWVGAEVKRRAAEKALAESEQTYRALYDNALVGLGRSAVKDGRLVDANDRLAEMFGYKNAKQAIAEFVASEHYVDPGAREAMVQQLQKTGEVRDFEVAFTRKDGQIVWVRCFMRLDQDGDHIDFVGADVTERRRRERQAAEQSELLNVAFNNMAQGMIVFDGNKRILAANSRAAELIEVPAKMLTPGADFLDIVRLAAERGDYGPGDPNRILREVTAKTNETTVIQLERSLPNGKVLQIQAAPRPGGGQVVTYADVTEHRRRETEIEENSALLEAALENMEQGLVVFDGNQKILASNARAAELLDAPADMLAPGSDFLAFIRYSVERGDFGEGDTAKLTEQPISAAKSPTAERVERALRNGRVLVGQTNPRPGGGKVVTYSDVTEARRHERQIARQSELLAATFDNMVQGVLSFDRNFKVLAANSRVNELLDVPKSMVEPGADFTEVLRLSARRGDYGGGSADEHVAHFVDRMKERLELRHQRILPNGTVLEVHAKPDPSGGYLVTYTDITDLTRHEREIERQSKLLEDTLSNMAQGLVAFDSDLVILASNLQASQLLEIPTEMLQPGKNYGDMIRFAATRGDYGEGDPEELIEKFRQMAKGSEPQQFVRRRPGGRWIDTRGYPRPGGGYVATFADITELKRKEEEVAAQAQLLSVTFDNMAQGLLAMDGDLTILASNQNAARLMDLPPQMLAPGESFAAVIRYSAQRGDYGPGDVDELSDKFTALAKNLPGGEMQLERTLPDGTVVEVRGVTLPDGGNVFTHTDITERKTAEQEIQYQSTLLSSTLENMAQGLVALDADLNVLASNGHAAELLNVPPEMIQPGSDFGKFIQFAAERGDFGDGEIDEITAKQIAIAKKSHGEQFERRLPDGRTVEVRTTPIPGGGVIATYTDVTNRKRSEDRLKQLNAQLKSNAESLKRSNAELEQFAYVASHDLQEPLRMVSSYCQLLQSRYAERLDEDANEFINFAVNGADRMKWLIQDLLAYSRVGSRGNPFEPTDLADVYGVVAHNLGMAIEDSGATITCDTMPTVVGDRSQLVQLFQNLIGNAIKFRGDKPPKVHVGAERTDGEWRLSVRDNGVGIDPDYKDRVFVIFQRLHGAHEYEGTGIGLAVCKKIIERHRGKIWVESQLGEGSTFYFTLPTKGADA